MEDIRLTEAEWQVMEVLWKRESLSGREITEQLEQAMGWSRSTSLTLLRRLESKGAVSNDKTTSPATFSPILKRDQAVLQETTNLLNRLHQGSLSLLVSSLTKKQALSQKEIDELYQLLEKLEEKHD